MEMVENLNCRYIKKDIVTTDNEGLEGYRLRMVQANKIQGLVEADKRFLDGSTYLYYHITGMQNMREREPAINTTTMDDFVNDLDGMIRNLADYLLLQQEVCLSPEYIWFDIKEEGWKFIYVPGYEGCQRKDIECLLEYLMDHIDCQDENGLERFYSFYSDALQSMEQLSIAEIVRLWRKGEVEIVQSECNKKTLESQGAVCESPLDESIWSSEPETNKKEDGKGKIYSVPFHGIKVSWQDDVSLT